MRGRKHSPGEIAKRAASLKAFWASLSDEERARRIEHMMPTGNYPSALEKIVAATLDELRVEYRAQDWIHIVGRQERHSFCPDFLIPALGLVIEVQGCYWHGCAKCHGKRGCQKHVADDRRRKETLEAAGYKVEFIWEHDIESGAYVFILEDLLYDYPEEFPVLKSNQSTGSD
jgi:G:T-mismatch repair DNA endonuclease (very short patch repair protein)